MEQEKEKPPVLSSSPADHDNIESTMENNSVQKQMLPESSEPIPHGLPFYCHICMKGFGIGSALSRHLNSGHPEVEKPFLCAIVPDCRLCFKASYQLSFHMESEHAEEVNRLKKKSIVVKNKQRHQCPKCPKSYCYKSALTFHLKNHPDTNDKPMFLCSNCGSTFPKVGLLIKHEKEKCDKLIKRMAEKTLKCDHCDKIFKMKDSLRNHMHIEHGIKPKKRTRSRPVCTICGFKASGPKGILVHSVVHTKEKPHECKACHMKFSFSGTLNKHIRQHCEKTKKMGLSSKLPTVIKKSNNKQKIPAIDDQGRFKCGLCTQTFKEAGSAKIHELNHGNDFHCEFCAVGFKKFMGLVMHRLYAHPEKNAFTCEDCGEACLSKKGLLKHRWECPKPKEKKTSTTDKDKGNETLKVKGQ